jgi:hypothetical protein
MGGFLMYAGHQVGPKDSGSRNLSFLAFKGEVVGVAQISRSTVKARDIRIFFSLKSSFYLPHMGEVLV